MKKKFLLRIDESVYTALEKWASDDLRSINAQIEFLLQEALKKAGRKKIVKPEAEEGGKHPETPPEE